MYSPIGNSLNFPKTIKELTQDGELFESRFYPMYTEDLYRLADDQADNGFLWFVVRRGSYERIKWLSLDEAGAFIADSVIDEIVRDERSKGLRP